MSPPEPATVVKRSDLPLGPGVHNGFSLQKADPKYDNAEIRQKAESFAAGLYMRAAEEEFRLLLNPLDLNRAREVSVESYFQENKSKAAEFPGLEDIGKGFARTIVSWGRSVARGMVRAAHFDAAEIFTSITGLGTDEERVFKVFEKYVIASEAQRKLLSSVYETRYGRNLHDDLEGDFSGPDLIRVRAGLAGNAPKHDAANLLNLLSTYKEEQLGEKLRVFYSSRTKEESAAAELSLQNDFPGAIKVLIQARFNPHVSDKQATLDYLFDHLVLPKSRLIIEAFRKDDPFLQRIALTNYFLSSTSKRHQALGEMFRFGRSDLPGFTSAYDKTMKSFGINGGLADHLEQAFSVMLRKNPTEGREALKELLIGRGDRFFVQWTKSIDYKSFSSDSARDLFQLFQFAALHREEIPIIKAPHLLGIGPEYSSLLLETSLSTPLPPRLARYILKSSGEPPEVFFDALKSLPDDQRQVLRQTLQGLENQNSKALAASIRKRFSRDAATLVNTLLFGNSVPELSPYKTDLGGPLSSLAIFSNTSGMEGRRHEQLKDLVLNTRKDKEFSTELGQRRNDSMEFLLGVFRDIHVLNLQESSKHLAEATVNLVTAIPIGISLASTRGSSAVPALAIKEASKPAMRYFTRALLGTAIAGLAPIERRLIEGDLYQGNEEDYTHLLETSLMVAAAQLAPGALKIAGRNLYRYGERLKALDVSPERARRLVRKKIESPSLFSDMPAVRAFGAGAAAGMAAGGVSWAMGGNPDDIVVLALSSAFASSSSNIAARLSSDILDAKAVVPVASNIPQKRVRPPKTEPPVGEQSRQSSVNGTQPAVNVEKSPGADSRSQEKSYTPDTTTSADSGAATPVKSPPSNDIETLVPETPSVRNPDLPNRHDRKRILKAKKALTEIQNPGSSSTSRRPPKITYGPITFSELQTVLTKLGYKPQSSSQQIGGSHYRWANEDGIVIPLAGKPNQEVADGTMKTNLNRLKLSRSEFQRILDGDNPRTVFRDRRKNRAEGSRP